MYNKKNQFQSYTYAITRLSSSILTRDPNSLIIPEKKSSLHIQIGLILSLLIAIGYVIINLLFPDNNAWAKNNNIVRLNDSNQLMVYSHSSLIPIKNYTSALILTKHAAGYPIITIADKNIKNTSINNNLVGLDNAPDMLPATNNIKNNIYSQCTKDNDKTNIVLSKNIELNSPNINNHDKSAIIQIKNTNKYYIVYNHHILSQINNLNSLADIGYYQIKPFIMDQNTFDTITSNRNEPLISSNNIKSIGERSNININNIHLSIGQVLSIKDKLNNIKYFLVQKDILYNINTLTAELLLNNPEFNSLYGGDTKAINIENSELKNINIQQYPDKTLPANLSNITEPNNDNSLCIQYQLSNSQNPTIQDIGIYNLNHLSHINNTGIIETHNNKIFLLLSNNTEYEITNEAANILKYNISKPYILNEQLTKNLLNGVKLTNNIT